MKSIRYRKMMEASRRLAEGQPLTFTIQSEEDECSCSLSIWKEQLFYSIEKSIPLKDLLPQFKDWVDLPYQVLGKKSSQIAVSRSRAYCLKILSNEDVQEFERIIDEYTKFKSVEQQSILVPIFGLVSLHSHNIKKNNKWVSHFIFMPYFGNNAILFDIKGHCDNRVVDERDFKDFKFGKDQNFIKSSFIGNIEKLGQQIKLRIFKKILVNVEFLKKLGLIDYSLLLIFKPKGGNKAEQYKPMTVELNETHEMGICIIDFLQGYNSKKKLQNKIKTFFFKEVSSVDPQTYAKRLLQFMRKVLLLK